MYFDKKKCLDRARKLLEQDNDDFLRYICLELRYCIELIVYENVKNYVDEKRLSPSIINDWQPTKIMKNLCTEEPLADKDYELAIFPEISPGVPAETGFTLGKHRKLSYKWLNKNYNKLGSYLHVPSLKQNDKQSIEEIREYIDKTINYISSIIEETTLGGIGFSMISNFECQECKELILVDSEGLKKIKTLECRNDKCGAVYMVLNENEDYRLQLAHTNVKCDECGNVFWTANYKIKKGFKYECDKCNAQYVVKDFSITTLTEAFYERIK